jgi:general secretion pathway protein K
MKPRSRPPKGAALLVAMIVLTLVSTLAAGMVWQQARAIEVEAAERTRAQGAWILTGAVDLGRVFLRLDARKPGLDHPDELWAMQLDEASLSSLLAQDRNNNVEGAPEAFLRGSIRDAQDRYNLRNLVDPATQKVVEAELAALMRLCETAAVAPQTAQTLAAGLQAAWRTGPPGETENEGKNGTVLAPQTVDQLVWFGLDAETVRRLKPFVDLLPEPTPLNIHTASPEVLAAVVAGLDLGSAKRLQNRRPRGDLQSARGDIQGEGALDPKRLSVTSNFFVISGRLRMDGRVLEERVLVKRENRQVIVLARSRRTLHPGLE